VWRARYALPPSANGRLARETHFLVWFHVSIVCLTTLPVTRTISCRMVGTQWITTRSRCGSAWGISWTNFNQDSRSRGKNWTRDFRDTKQCYHSTHETVSQFCLPTGRFLTAPRGRRESFLQNEMFSSIQNTHTHTHTHIYIYIHIHMHKQIDDDDGDDFSKYWPFCVLNTLV
jgi:hypothetical protein